MKHLILVGACYLDTILRKDSAGRPVYASPSDPPYSVPRYPEEDSKLRATSLQVRRGGNCANSLEVLQQLLGGHDDVRPYLVSCLPEQSSPATRRVIASFGGNTRVDFRHCIYRHGHTEAASSYIIRSEESGSRTLVNYNDLPEMTAREFEDIVRSFSADQDTWWHFEGRIPDTTLDCIRMLRNTLPAARISVEVEKPGRQGLPELAAEADVVFYSRTWAENRGHKSAEACLRNEQRRRGSLGLCTWGAGGAAALSQPSGGCFRCPVEEQPGGISVVDSASFTNDPPGTGCGRLAGPAVLQLTCSSSNDSAVGAGDTFIAGMLYGLVCPTTAWGVGRSLRFAVNLATLKVQREGFGLGADASTAHGGL
ncbi:Ketohexokinase [Tolypocladium capitatum]|uniref:Ketohexokinase n=1 Tax=Tolypocladium capitatum TaxID=45235 RepID=A0A2K3QBG5_9HYPO|nr:Ketohexokinase [Tolypocladium capitatum]